jgi:hypothetical protein
MVRRRFQRLLKTTAPPSATKGKTTPAGPFASVETAAHTMAARK